MSVDQRKWTAAPAAAMERRSDNARREAYEQRDRSKRLGMAQPQTKSTSKLDTTDVGSMRYF